MLSPRYSHTSQRIEKLTGTFDIIFVDANKDGYLGYVKAILDKKLLSTNGVIMCDNSESDTDHALFVFHGLLILRSICTRHDNLHAVEPGAS